MGNRDRWAAWVYGLVGVFALALTITTLPGAKRGDIDPMGAITALAGLAVAGWSGHISWRALRQQETNTTDSAAKLAEEVFKRETLARYRLLGQNDRSIDVDFTLRPSPHHDAAGARASGHLGDITSYYQQLTPRRLVITGVPGAGKTVLALELVLGLLRDREPEDQVPLRLSLPSWSDLRAPDSVELPRADPAGPLRTWICRHLVDEYRMSPVAAKALFDAGKVLPVLDGLDEMDADDARGWPSKARKALEVLNAYQHGLIKANLVITCRSDQYRALTGVSMWVEDAAEVEIESVGPDKARAFLGRRAKLPARWGEVLDAIERDPSEPLGQGLSTPWRLTLAVVVYEQRDQATGRFRRDPRDLLSPALATPELVRDHLLSNFIEATIATHPAPRGTSYSVAQVHAWLNTLADYIYHVRRVGPGVIGNVLLGSFYNHIALDELWPIPALRSNVAFRVLGTILSIPWLTTTVSVAAMLAVPNGTSPFILAAVLAVIPILVFYVALPTMIPRYIGFNRPWIRSGVSDVMLGLSGGLTSGLVFGFGPGGGIGFALWLVFGAAFGAGVGLYAQAPGLSNRRRESGRVTLTFWVAGGVAFAFADQIFGDPGIGSILWAVATVGVLVWLNLTVANSLIMAGTRYIVLLLCTRRGAIRLPWRLGRFLYWAETVGLVRVAGPAYQFRHQEFQHWVAVNPQNCP
ncbi:NACHT domain-containing protein [Streptomyces sp. NEAU-S77]|uniref:NACHT domain-containing protein n=1 Tax=Streptomyces sp. NEAU-S77 TaxID=3411033 RepID=UPI003BA2DE8A